MPRTEVVANAPSFRAEARYQRVCACCGKSGGYHSHHVVDKRTLMDQYGVRGKNLYDTRNALRLCEGLDTDRCHMNFENRRVNPETGRVIVTTKMLTDDNIEYAFEVMGLYAVDYLRREYDDETDPDPRIQLKVADG
jgi:hypothetical protein